MKRTLLSFIFGVAFVTGFAPAALGESFTRALSCPTAPSTLVASINADQHSDSLPWPPAMDPDTALNEPDQGPTDDTVSVSDDTAAEDDPASTEEEQTQFFNAIEALACLNTEPAADDSFASLYPSEAPATVCPPSGPEYSAAWIRQAYYDPAEDLSTEDADAQAQEEDLPEIPIVVNKSVESYIKYFQTRGRKHFEKWLGRSQEYMSMLRSILRENGLPEDLSYIAFIESGLNPKARSGAKAVGMWQFIKGTAKIYGLRIDWWIDERMDPEKATYAAAKYFKNLYDQFGSWYLAAAGYNAGEGKVRRVMRKHKTEDFWVLASRKKSFARETKNYVPKYLAALLIARDPVAYGFDEQETGEGIAYDKVKVSQATDLRVIANAAGTTIDEIKKLNPELLRWFTPPNYPDYEVKIPAGKADVFAENMSKVPPSERIAFLAHKIRRGDTLSRIARKYGTSVKPIVYINNISAAQKRRLRPGTYIMIPVRAKKKIRRHSGDVAEVVTYWGAKG